MYNTFVLERADIELILPHRGRALLLDRAELTHNGAVGYLTVREDITEGHFPGNPIMKGYDRAEMLVQTLGLAASTQLEGGYLAFLVKADGLRWPRLAILGNLVRAEAEITRRTRRIIEGKGEAFVGDKLVAAVSFISFVIARAPT